MDPLQLLLDLALDSEEILQQQIQMRSPLLTPRTTRVTFCAREAAELA
jgi:hypothetical protein